MTADATLPRPLRASPVPPGRAAGLPLPWWAKLGAKLVLGALRVPPAWLRAARLGRHSFEEASPAKLLGAPREHVDAFTALHGRPPRLVLEIGPARMVARAPVWAALGVAEVWFLDVEDDAPAAPGPYLRAAALAREAGLAAPALDGCADRGAVLARCGARLLIGGPDRLAALPPGGAELVVSEAVLEHVRRDAVAPLLAALARATAPGGLHRHAIDLQDHLGGGRRHLGFPAAWWEGAAIARSGVYTNRLGATAWLAAFAEAGLAAEIAHAELWETPPPPARAHPDAGHRPEDTPFAALHVTARPADGRSAPMAGGPLGQAV